MSSFFVTGTDTGVGKTVITGLLARYFSDQNYEVLTQKWVQTGLAQDPLDLTVHHQFFTTPDTMDLRDCCPYQYELAASPHLAAAQVQDGISPKVILDAYDACCMASDVLLVEGAGGFLVPLSDHQTMASVVQKTGMPVVIVAENRLGVINQVCLTVEAIQQRGLPIIGIVMNCPTSSDLDPLIAQDNVHVLRALTELPVVGPFPYLKNKQELIQMAASTFDGLPFYDYVT